MEAAGAPGKVDAAVEASDTGASDSEAPDSEPVESQDAQPTTAAEDVDDAVSAFDLSRRHVLSPLGRAQTAQRWYEGPRGPKSLSTKTASGNLCSTCGFFVALQGDLSEMFGVCANKWSPDDGKVVSLDHGCGEHSEIEPPEPSHMWIQSKPAFDDLHIDVIAQAPRDERSEVELIENPQGWRGSVSPACRSTCPRARSSSNPSCLKRADPNRPQHGQRHGDRMAE